ncbi:MAG: hypothetical protein ABR886_08460 [Dehalococcoidales bacterium]
MKILDLAIHSPELLPPCLTNDFTICDHTCEIFDPGCIICLDNEAKSLLIDEVEKIHRIYGTINIELEGKIVNILISILKENNNKLHIDVVEKILLRDFPELTTSRNQIVRIFANNPSIFKRIERGLYSIQLNVE